jgi:hypothetical protein
MRNHEQKASSNTSQMRIMDHDESTVPGLLKLKVNGRKSGSITAPTNKAV